MLDDFSNFIHRISRVGSGSAADDSKAQKNAANAISLPEERVAHFFSRSMGIQYKEKEETPQPKRISIFWRGDLRCTVVWGDLPDAIDTYPQNISACASGCGNMQHIDSFFLFVVSSSLVLLCREAI